MGTQTILDMEGGTSGANVAAAADIGAASNTLNGGSLTYSSTTAAHGAVGARWATVLSPTTAAACQSRFNFTSNAIQSFSGVVTLPTQTTDATPYSLAVFRNPGTGMRLVYQETTQTLAIQDAASTTQRTIATGLTPGGKYRVEIRINSGSSITTGTLSADVYTPTGTTPIGTVTPYTANNFGAGGVFATFDLGVVASKQDRVVGWDYVRHEDGRTTQWGAVPSSTPPTAVINIQSTNGGQYPQVGATITLDADSSTAGGGSITGWAWTATHTDPAAPTPSLGAPTTHETTLVCEAGGVYDVQLIVTQTDGTPSAAVHALIYVHEVSAGRVKIRDRIGSTLWTNEGGAASDVAALNDTNVVTNISSPAGPAGQSATYRLNPLGVGTLKIKANGDYESAAVHRTFTLYAEDGTTTIDTHTYDPTAADATEVWDVAGSIGSYATFALRRALQVKVADTTA